VVFFGEKLPEMLLYLAPPDSDPPEKEIVFDPSYGEVI